MKITYIWMQLGPRIGNVRRVCNDDIHFLILVIINHSRQVVMSEVGWNNKGCINQYFF